MSDGEDVDESHARMTRRQILAAAGGVAGTASIAAGATSNGDNHIAGGDMALDEAGKVSGKLWMGPEAGRSDVEPKARRVYMASDTQVQYYGDGDSWNKMGIGSAEESVPSVSTDKEDIGEAFRDPASGSEIGSIIDELVPNRPNTEPSDGGQVRLVNNETLVDSPIQLAGGITLSGQNKHSSQLGASADFSGDAVVVYAPPQEKEFFPRIEQMSVRGGYDKGTSTRGVYFHDENGGNPQDARIDGLFVRDCDLEGIVFDNTWGYNVTDFLVEGCGFGSPSTGAAMQVSGDQSDYVMGFIMKNRAEWGLRIPSGSSRTYFELVEIRNNEMNGVDVSSSRTHFHHCQVQGNGQSSAGTYNGALVSAGNCRFSDCLFDGRSVTKNGMSIFAPETLVKNTDFKDHTNVPVKIGSNEGYEFNTFVDCDGVNFNTIEDGGARTIIDGRSLNSGNPDTEGQWNGYAQDAYERGVDVYDTSVSPWARHHAVPDGSGNYVWEQISTT